jgi:hypothetical protein
LFRLRVKRCEHRRHPLLPLSVDARDHMRDARRRRFVPHKRGGFPLIDPETDPAASARRLDRDPQSLEMDVI